MKVNLDNRRHVQIEYAGFLCVASLATLMAIFYFTFFSLTYCSIGLFLGLIMAVGYPLAWKIGQFWNYFLIPIFILVAGFSMVLVLKPSLYKVFGGF
ncbi:hypothetical protein [Catenovulum adriaticum]|uniref:Uncharacterized protein n=1 Tax=Catenovulum adriaticum TaxID=2984846 RepID=A0ABY7AUC7_9ALTE|nr:hypothetical protein [Catenovulum sp. TS8]WAJ72130.1 hypothetical protein OLW01_17775 [Catenovulum sp. TS8]